MLMKKFFIIAASALMVFASCSKVNINYENDGQPQEIGVFAVNKNMVKGAFESTSDFPTTYPMLVSAYLVSGTDNTTRPGEYFNDITFGHNNGVWTGGQYWPLSQASINFLAVAPEITGVATTSTTTTAEYSKTATVVVTSNETNQYDVMYAVGNGTKADGQATSDVQLTFQHALSWINFTVTCGNSGNAPTITCNSITLNNAYFNGTNTVTANSFNASPTVVLGTWNTTNASVTETHNVNLNGGALVIPKSYTKSNEANANNLSFTINYTVTQGRKAFTYDYTHVFETVTWEPGKKYTYAVKITLKEITIEPSVGPWDDTDEKGTEDDETDDTPWGSDINL